MLALLAGTVRAPRLHGEDRPNGAAAAPAGALPRFAEAGPYPVGVRTLVLVDESRDDAFTKTKRTLVTEVWYPAPESARRGPRTRFQDFFAPFIAEAEKALKRPFTETEARFHTLAVRDAPLGAGGRRPLLIFSHGNGGFRHQNVFQMDHLASHGYIVLSPDHTGNASLSPLPDGPVRMERGGRGRSADDRPRDVRFLIDWALAESGRSSSWLHQAVDEGKIGVLGHSFGGYTACSAAAQDPRIRAIAPMTVAVAGLGVAPARIPTLVFIAKHDKTMGEAGNFVSRGYFLGCEAEKYLVELVRGGHFTFSEMAVLDPEFGDGIGRGKGLRDQEIEFIPTALAKRVINSYTLAFFDLHLKADEAAKLFLSENRFPDELEYRRESAKAPEPGAKPGP